MSDRMLPKLNRNTSMLNSSLNAPVTSYAGYHSMQNGLENSPLKLFSRAKQAINSIYDEFNSFITEIYTFLDSPELARSQLIDDKEIHNLKSYQEKCDGLIRMISRDRMKCVFFGRTSNGKSTVINAMLHDKILPTGIGHTTNCFLQVEGNDSADDTPCIYTPDNDVPQNIKDLNHLGSALSEQRLDSSSLVRVVWPKEKCRLLKEDVVFVDSPGIDVSSDLDLWIDQQCMDADVFVLVVNAESTLTKTEKEFFHKVSERLSKPNVFILNNRWDATAYEPESAEVVRRQHMERTTEFLVDELKVCTKQEVNNRIYFVSAREALFTRTQANPSLPPGYQSRLLQFEWFEAEFEKCISMSAVKTKFEQPSQRGKAMALQIHQQLDEAHANAARAKAHTEHALRLALERIEIIEKKLQDFTFHVKSEIRQMMDDVERSVSGALSDEIKRIYSIVDQYERPFHPDEHQINWYKTELHKFVELKLGVNLSTRLNNALLHNLDRTHTDIKNRVLELVNAEDNRRMIQNTVTRSDFMINYRLDCSNLCSDFREDISFHFSLGLTALLRRFTGNRSLNASSFLPSSYSSFGASRSLNKRTASGIFNTGDYNVKHMSSGDLQLQQQQQQQQMQQQQQNSNLNAFSSASDAANLMVILQGVQLLTSKSNILMLVAGGVVWRGLGWKILAISGSMYGACYLYERLMWTRKTQEKLFKKQYADFASSKLKLVVDLTSQNAACQVQQELSMFFSQMCRYIDITRDEYFEEMKRYEEDIKSFNLLLNQSKILKNKGKYIHDDFENFAKEFLQ